MITKLRMRQPTSASAAPTATETVTRPDPGLARGKWEAPAWAFWVALAVAIVGVGNEGGAVHGLGRGLAFTDSPRPGADFGAHAIVAP